MRDGGQPPEALEELNRRLHDLSIRYELACTLTHPRPAAEVLDDFLDRLARALQAEVAIVFAEGPPDGAWAVHGATGLARRQAATTSLDPALLAGGPNAVRLDSAELARVVPSLGGRLQTGALVRLRSGERGLGALLVARVAATPLPQAQLGLVAEMAGRLALRLDHARLYEELANADLATAVGQAGDAIEITDAEGTVLFANPAWERLFGYRREEALGQSGELLRGTDATEHAARAAALSGQVWTGRMSARRRAGDALELDATMSPARDGRGVITRLVLVWRDQTDSVRAARALQESEERYALAQRGANDGLWDWNLATGQLYFSERWHEILGLSARELGASMESWLGRVHPDDLERVHEGLDRHLRAETPHFRVEHRIRHLDGRWVWVLTRGLAFRDALGVPTRMAGSVTDIRQRKSTETKLEYLATHDALTGIANRQVFTDRLQRCVERRRADPRAGYAALFIDLDRFKAVNDSLGHEVGDQLLIAVAERVRSCLRAEDLAARLGGDEFAVLLDGLEEPAAVRPIAERILAAVTRRLEVDRHALHPGCSIGAALGGRDYQDAGEVLRDADTAMYDAKAGGRGRVEIFDARLHARITQEQALESELCRAIASREFFFAYQPIVDLGDGRIEGAEALLRWRHPTRGVLLPDAFLPDLEAHGLVHEVWGHVLPEALAQALLWQAVAPGSWVSLNVSPSQLAAPAFVEHLRAALRASGLGPSCLKLELTEAALLRDAPRATLVLEELGALGVGVLLDDFGTGTASLGILRQFRFEQVKLDRASVRNVETRPEEARVANAFVELATACGVTSVLAEGVETRGQGAMLHAFGCSHAQGYLFARPLDPAALLLLLAARRPGAGQPPSAA